MPSSSCQTEGHCYLEGHTSQSEGLEVSLGFFNRTQNKSFFAGADVVLTVTVQWTHTRAKDLIKLKTEKEIFWLKMPDQQ